MTVANDVLRYPFDAPAGTEMVPPDEYVKLRADQPVRRVELPNGRQAWVVSRYADVRFVLGDARFSNEAATETDVLAGTPWQRDKGSLIVQDPPDHTRLRKLVGGAFTKKNIQRWRPRTEQLAAELIAKIRERGAPADLVDDYATPLSIAVICELLGVPASDRNVFHTLAQRLLGAIPGDVAEAATGLAAYLTEHVAQHREHPRDDLLSELIAVRDEDEGRLTEEELVVMGTTILVAGHVPSSVAIADYIYVLLAAGKWAELAALPQLPDSVVEELLRQVSIGDNVMPRVATEDVAIGNRLIREGDVVFAAMVSANADESVFEHADRLDLQRTSNPHVAFGYGAHYCLGAHLARLEIKVALGSLLREFPTLRLAVPPGEVPLQKGMPARILAELSVRW